jgi:predicted permease
MPDWNAYVRERLRLPGVRPECEQNVIDELSAQLEDSYLDAIARGLPEAEARAAATMHVTDWPGLARQIAESRRLPSPALCRLEVHAEEAAVGGGRRAGFLDRLVQALRFAARIRRHRGYFIFATATLAFAVGMNLIVFTIVNALWLRPLPFPDADRVVTVTSDVFSTPDAPALARLCPRPFEAVAGQVMTDDDHYLGSLLPRLALNGRDVETVGVTPEYFRVLRLVIRGRDFTLDDNRTGAEPVAIISDRLWAREFGRRTDVIGAVASAQPFSFRIVGIAPSGFEGARRGEQTDIWIPSNLVSRAAGSAGASSWGVLMMIFARLAPGQSADEVARHLHEKPVEDPGGRRHVMTVVPLKEVFGTPTSRTMLIREGKTIGVVAGLAMLVLAGGCSTLAALVLVHYERRRRELAVRIALGASRVRLIGELTRELLLIAGSGTIGAVVVALWGLRAIPSLSLPGGVDLGRIDLSIDWRVLGVAVTATLLTLMAAACLPVRRFTRAELAGELLAGPAATPSAASQRTRQVLLALHVSATIVVLIAAGLFVRAVIHGFGSGPGFDFEHTAFATVQVSFPSDRSSIKSPSDYAKFDLNRMNNDIAKRRARVRNALRSLPGVEDVAEGASPIDPDATTRLLAPTVVETEGMKRELHVATMSGSPELLSALSLPLLAGRALTSADAATKPMSVIVTDSLARLLWSGENPLGKLLSCGGRRSGWCQVVGVTRDFVYGSFTRPAAGIVVSVDSGHGGIARFVIRAARPEALVGRIHQAAQKALPEGAWVKVATGREIIARDLGRQRLGAWFFSGFGFTALLIGVGGVFGLVAYLAESRQREFGVRLAMGATPRDLVRHGLAAALVPVALGAAAGLVLAAWVSRLFTSLLTGLSSLDPLTYVTVAVMMLGCAGLAGLGAAWRLRRMVPMDALRTD